MICINKIKMTFHKRSLVFLFMIFLILLSLPLMIGTPLYNNEVLIGENFGVISLGSDQNNKVIELKINNKSEAIFEAYVEIYDQLGTCSKELSFPIENLKQAELFVKNISLPSNMTSLSYSIIPNNNNLRYQYAITDKSPVGNSLDIKKENGFLTVIGIDTKEQKNPQLKINVPEGSKNLSLAIYSTNGQEVALENDEFAVEGTLELPINSYVGPDFKGYLHLFSKNNYPGSQLEIVTESSSPLPKAQDIQTTNINTPDLSSSVSRSFASTRAGTNINSNTDNIVVNTRQQPIPNTFVAGAECLVNPTATISSLDGKGKAKISLTLDPKAKGKVIAFSAKKQVSNDCSGISPEDQLAVLESGSGIEQKTWEANLINSCGLFVGACFLPCTSCEENLRDADPKDLTAVLLAQQAISCDETKVYYRVSPANHYSGAVGLSKDGQIGDCKEADQIQGYDCQRYLKGSKLELTADPVADFSRWSEACSGTSSAICKKTLSSNSLKVTAEFKAEEVWYLHLKVIISNGANGSVNFSQLGYLDENCPANKKQSGYRCLRFLKKNDVILTASPDNQFVQWGDTCLGKDTVCLEKYGASGTGKKVTAKFDTIKDVLLYIKEINSSRNIVTNSPTKIGNCDTGDSRSGYRCYKYRSGTEVTLNAVETSDNIFVTWHEACADFADNNICKLILNDKETRATAEYLAFCGNGYCSEDEDCSSCSDDCGRCCVELNSKDSGTCCSGLRRCSNGYCRTSCPPPPSCVANGSKTAGTCCSDLQRCSDDYCRTSCPPPPSCVANGSKTAGTCCSGLQRCSDDYCRTSCPPPPSCVANGSDASGTCCSGTQRCSDNFCRNKCHNITGSKSPGNDFCVCYCSIHNSSFGLNIVGAVNDSTCNSACSLRTSHP